MAGVRRHSLHRAAHRGRGHCHRHPSAEGFFTSGERGAVSARVGRNPKMPQKPTSAFAPSIDVDDSNKYLVELVAMDEQPSQFRDKRKDAMMCTYKFNMWDMETGQGIIDDNTGEMFELWKITNDLTYDNPATNKIAPGREIANALVGHRLTDDEVNEMLDSGWEDALVGKKAIADVEWAELSDGGQRLRLLRLKPYVKKAKEPAAVGASARRGPRPSPGDELP